MRKGAYQSNPVSRRRPLQAGHRAASPQRHRAPLLLALFAAALGQQAIAAPMASSDSYDLSVDVSVLGGLQALNVPPQAHVNVAAQVLGFHQTLTAAPINVASAQIAPLITLSADTLNAEAQWIPPASNGGFLVVGAQGSASHVALNAVQTVGGNSLLSLGAQLIRATAVVSGYCPVSGGKPGMTLDSFVDDIAADAVYRNGFDAQNLHGGVTSENDGLAASVTGTPFVIPANPAPNTTLSILGGTAVLVLNEQTTGGDGITGASMTGNALHLSVNVLNLITAEVIIGHASVGVTCN